jgi:chromosome segregation ATPase
MLKNYLTAIENRVKAADNNIQRLAYMKMKLHKDLEAKAVALEVDTKALEGEMSDEKGGDDIFCSAASVQPHQWSRQTEDTIKAVNSLARETERFRQESKQMLRDNELKRKTTAAVLNKAMLEKLNDTDDLRSQLQLKHDEVVKEIEAAKHRRQSLEHALGEKRGPLERANKRLVLRQQRPSYERVNDEAHRALMAEIQHLTIVTNSLKQKISAVDREIQHLEAQKERMEENIKDKQRSWKVDEECVLMDGRVALADPPSSIWSSSSSVRTMKTATSKASSTSTQRSDILARISRLEAEVANARSERIALEDKVAELKTTD